MGNVYDVAMLSRYLQHNDFESLISHSLDYFTGFVAPGASHMSAQKLEELPHIAHNAMFILCLVECYRDPALVATVHVELISSLSNGILAQQREDGSFKIYFDFRYSTDSGWEFYASEAILALVRAYEYTQESRFLSSAKKAYLFYMTMFRNDKVREDLFVFFWNWQAQAGKLLYDHEPDQSIADYLFELHQEIVKSSFYRLLREHPEDQATVKVACALEGLSDAYILAKQADNVTMTNEFKELITIAAHHLLSIQEKKDQIGKGGFGHGVGSWSRKQRLDITGHVQSSFIKILQGST